MTQKHQEELWQDFPKDLLAFEARFGTEEACISYLTELRWNGNPCCSKCSHEKVWTVRDGQWFECASCGHQTSLRSGTLFHRSRKPLKLWFRAIWEICVHRPGISAKDLQRILGFGSYETAWTWLHKIRTAMVRPDREKLGGCIQMDEIFVGGKGNEKAVVIVAAEENGRTRLVHAPGNHEEAIKHMVDRETEGQTTLKTDGHAGYNKRSVGKRQHKPKVQSPDEKKEDDHVQLCHWNASHVKRWLLGTHFGAVSEKHLQAYLEEYAFRQNRRKTKGVGRIVARVLENMIGHKPKSMRQLVDDTLEFRHFQDVSY